MRNQYVYILAISLSALVTRAHAADPLFDTRLDYPVGMFPISACAVDLNGDGYPDVAAATDGPGNVSVVLNDGRGLFGAAVNYGVQPRGNSVCAADFNGDFKMDIAVSTADSVLVYLGNGDGTLAAATAYYVGAITLSLCAADFNGDGRQDLAAMWASGAHNVSVLMNSGGGTFSPPVAYGSGWLWGGKAMVASDFTGDGKPDLACVDQGNDFSGDEPGWLIILINNGNGSFVQSSGGQTMGQPRGLCASDFDSDGVCDLAVAERVHFISRITFYRGNGNGTFSMIGDYTMDSTQVAGICTADIDADGTPDLAVSIGDQMWTLRGSGNFIFAPPVKYNAANSPTPIFTADLSKRGQRDIVVGNYGAASVSVFKNKGDGTFPSVPNFLAGLGTWSAVAADFDGNGKKDLVVVNASSHNVSLLKGDGTGSFQPPVHYAVGSYPRLAVAEDFDGNGHPDIAVMNAVSNDVSVLLNAGAGVFAPAITYAAGSDPVSICSADFDGDGKPDLAVANRTAQNVSVFRNNGNGTFAAAVNYGVSGYPTSLCAVDVIGNSKPDLAIACDGSNIVSVLANNGNGIFAWAGDIPGFDIPRYIASGDFNRDGLQDLAVVNAGLLSVSIVLNQPVPYPVHFPIGGQPHALSVSDLDGDGNVDLAVSHVFGDVSVLVGDGHGSFSSTFMYGPSGGAPLATDLNGDDANDLVVPGGDGVWILLNQRSCCTASTGNVDCDPGDGVDISDLSALIDNLYISFAPLCCAEEANTDGQPGIDISDLSALIDYLYISFTPPAACQ